MSTETYLKGTSLDTTVTKGRIVANINIIGDQMFVEYVPEYIRGAPKVFLDKAKKVWAEIDHKMVDCGTYSPYRDEHGNMLWYATSAYSDAEVILHGKASGAEHWLKLSAMTTKKLH
jgi:hypothetical protein